MSVIFSPKRVLLVLPEFFESFKYLGKSFESFISLKTSVGFFPFFLMFLIICFIFLICFSNFVQFFFGGIFMSVIFPRKGSGFFARLFLNLLNLLKSLKSFKSFKSFQIF